MAQNVEIEGRVKPPLGIPPPLVGLALIGVGLGIHFAIPRRLLPEGWVQLVVGLPLVAVGLALVTTALARFSVADTDERYARHSSVMVQDGLYARTRNPMFLGAAVFQLGVIVAVNAAWALAAVVFFVLYLRLGVISREERYLKERFGEEYRNYLRRVPRWIPAPKA